MRKIISVLLISLFTLTVIGVPYSTPDQSSGMTDLEMVLVEGGLPWGCWAAMGGMVVATGGMVAGAASLVGFGFGCAGLVFATAALVDGCRR